MEISALRCFLCAAKNLNFTKAAAELFISQPTLSYHISSLEKELNTTLFIRDKKQVFLTDAGKILYREVSQALEHLDIAEQKIEELTNVDNLFRFGFLELLITPCFNDYIAPFLHNHTDLRFSLERRGFSVVNDLSVNHRYDFVFSRSFMMSDESAFFPQGMAFKTMKKDSFSLVLPYNHPFPQENDFQDFSFLNNTSYIAIDKKISGNIYDSLFFNILTRHGFRANQQTIIVDNIDELLAYVAAGQGFSILPFFDSIPANYHNIRLFSLNWIDSTASDIILVWNPTFLNREKKAYIDFINENFPGKVSYIRSQPLPK